MGGSASGGRRMGVRLRSFVLARLPGDELLIADADGTNRREVVKAHGGMHHALARVVL